MSKLIDWDGVKKFYKAQGVLVSIAEIEKLRKDEEFYAKARSITGLSIEEIKSNLSPLKCNWEDAIYAYLTIGRFPSIAESIEIDYLGISTWNYLKQRELSSL